MFFYRQTKLTIRHHLVSDISYTGPEVKDSVSANNDLIQFIYPALRRGRRTVLSFLSFSVELPSQPYFENFIGSQMFQENPSIVALRKIYCFY